MCICVFVHLCICVCVYMCICVYVYVYLCICAFVYMCICVYVYMCICVYVLYLYMCICVYVYLCICVHVYLCICVYVYMCICVFVYMCICVYVHMCICVYMYMYVYSNQIICCHSSFVSRFCIRMCLILLAGQDADLSCSHWKTGAVPSSRANCHKNPASPPAVAGHVGKLGSGLKVVGSVYICIYIQKYGYPQIIHLNRVFHYKPSILGYPYFWKPPYVN